MIDTNKLKGLIVERQMSGTIIADKMGISRNTFYRKLNKGVLDSDEIMFLIKLLKIDNPTEIFFPEFVAYCATKKAQTSDDDNLQSKYVQ